MSRGWDWERKKFKLNFPCCIAGISRVEKNFPRTHNKWLILSLAIKIGNAFIYFFAQLPKIVINYDKIFKHLLMFNIVGRYQELVEWTLRVQNDPKTLTAHVVQPQTSMWLLCLGWKVPLFVDFQFEREKESWLIFVIYQRLCGWQVSKCNKSISLRVQSHNFSVSRWQWENIYHFIIAAVCERFSGKMFAYQ